MLDMSPQALTIDQLRREADFLGAPSKMQEVDARYERRGELLSLRGDPVQLAIEAVDAGRDPGSDRKVIAAVVAQRVMQTTDQLERLRQREIVAAYIEDAPVLLADWQARYAVDAKTVHDALDAGYKPDADPVEILNRGGTAAETFVAVRSATERLTKFADAWRLLASIAGGPARELPRAYVLADLPAADYDDWQTHGRQKTVTVADVVEAGATLRLPDFDQAVQVMEDAGQARRERQARIAAQEREHGRQFQIS